MVKQYPHIITITSKTGTRDDEGNWEQSGTTTIVSLKCRFEANAKGAMIVKEDGTQVVFSGIVFLPRVATELKPGSAVEVVNGSTVLSKARILRFSNGQLNARIWL
ncbi:MAG: hypothetical protein ACK40M_04335 [Flavobacteriales bacterium]